MAKFHELSNVERDLLHILDNTRASIKRLTTTAEKVEGYLWCEVCRCMHEDHELGQCDADGAELVEVFRLR